MTSSTKKRVAQIRHGQVPNGYRLTRCGIVPSQWDIVSIGDIGIIVTGSTPPTVIRDYYAGDRLFITPADFTEGIYIDNSNRTVSDSAYGVSRVIPPDSIYVVCIGATVGKTNMCRSVAICNQQINAIVPGDGYCNHFLYYCIEYFFNRTKARYVGTQTLPIVSKNLFSRVGLVLPPLAEQRKIAKILATQDRVIELLNRKIEQLKLLKKYYLRKMFPQHGKTEPEVRFPGFTGAWEKHQLGEIVSFSKGNGYSKADLKATGTPIILYGRLYTKYEMEVSDVDTFAMAKPGSVYSHGDEVIVPASGETAEDIAVASVVKQSGILLGGDINILTPSSDVDSLFMAISLSGGSAHGDVIKMAQGKSVVHLHPTDLRKVVLAYPTLSEQMRINGYFRHLERLIALNQHKQDEEVRKKKALMQLLLTGIVRVRGVESGVAKRLPADRSLLASGKQIRKARTKCRRIYQ